MKRIDLPPLAAILVAAARFAMNTPPPQVVIYSKPGCHLCDVAEKIVESCRAERAFDLVVRDISLDATLEGKYRNDVPVICVGEREVARHFIRKDTLLRALADAAMPRDGHKRNT